MREILFRGKCKDTGRWYEGHYIHLHKTTYVLKEDYDRYPDNDIHQIVFEQMTDWCLPNRHLRVDVLPETVGQYTGIQDQNGKRIFEGDILESRISENPEDWKIWTVGFEDGTFTFESVRKSIKSRRKYRHELNMICADEVKFYGLVLVGNVHDNPEMLEGEANG